MRFWGREVSRLAALAALRVSLLAILPGYEFELYPSPSVFS